jgi:hypothetical protein
MRGVNGEPSLFAALAQPRAGANRLVLRYLPEPRSRTRDCTTIHHILRRDELWGRFLGVPSGSGGLSIRLPPPGRALHGLGDSPTPSALCRSVGQVFNLRRIVNPPAAPPGRARHGLGDSPTPSAACRSAGQDGLLRATQGYPGQPAPTVRVWAGYKPAAG